MELHYSLEMQEGTMPLQSTKNDCWIEAFCIFSLLELLKQSNVDIKETDEKQLASPLLVWFWFKSPRVCLKKNRFFNDLWDQRPMAAFSPCLKGHGGGGIYQWNSHINCIFANDCLSFSLQSKDTCDWMLKWNMGLWTKTSVFIGWFGWKYRKVEKWSGLAPDRTRFSCLAPNHPIPSWL